MGFTCLSKRHFLKKDIYFSFSPGTNWGQEKFYFTKLQGRNTQFDVCVQYNYPLFFLYNMYCRDRMTGQEIHNTLPVINNKNMLLKLFHNHTYSRYHLFAFLTIL